MLLLIII